MAHNQQIIAEGDFTTRLRPFSSGVTAGLLESKVVCFCDDLWLMVRAPDCTGTGKGRQPSRLATTGVTVVAVVAVVAGLPLQSCAMWVYDSSFILSRVAGNRSP